MPKRYDAIIAGGGHNGLVTAAYLAKAGRRVLLLERRPMVGGCAVTEEIWKGYRVSTAAYLSSLMQQRIVDELELPRHGYHVEAKDPPFFSPFPDGRHLFMWQDAARTIGEVRKFSPRDAARLPAYEEHLERLARIVEWMLLAPPPPFPPRSLPEVIEAIRAAARLRGLPAKDLGALVKIFTQSAAEFLDEWFESIEVKATLATDGVIGANGGPRSAGTAYVLLHHCMGGVGGKRGVWGFVRGGMGAIPEAIAASARSYNAEIRCEADVARILTRGDRVEGVALRSGEEFRAPVVASNLDPRRTFLELLPESSCPAGFLDSIRRFRCEGTSLKINLALDGLPDFTALPGAPGPQHRATMHICPSVDYIERAWDHAKYGRPSEEPLLEMTVPTMYDPALAPPGRHIMGIFLQYAPYTLREGDWDSLRDAYADRVIGLIGRYAPNISSIIRERQVLTPLDMERVYGITGGNIFHGDMALDQLFVMRPVAGWARYRTPVKGLYLCGSGAHPGGGVMGAPGYNAARAILKHGAGG